MKRGLVYLEGVADGVVLVSSGDAEGYPVCTVALGIGRILGLTAHVDIPRTDINKNAINTNLFIYPLLIVISLYYINIS